MRRRRIGEFFNAIKLYLAYNHLKLAVYTFLLFIIFCIAIKEKDVDLPLIYYILLFFQLGFILGAKTMRFFYKFLSDRKETERRLLQSELNKKVFESYKNVHNQ